MFVWRLVKQLISVQILSIMASVTSVSYFSIKMKSVNRNAAAGTKLIGGTQALRKKLKIFKCILNYVLFLGNKHGIYFYSSTFEVWQNLLSTFYL